MGDYGDAFSSDSKETKDTDGDGHGDNSDVFPNDSSKWEEEKERDGGELPGFTFALTISALGITTLFRNLRKAE